MPTPTSLAFALMGAFASVALQACGASSGGAPVSDGAADSATSDGGGAKRSAGCGTAPPNQAFGQYVQHAEVVSGVAPAYAARYTNRVYWLRVPKGYDSSRAYPLVLIGPGCGQSGKTPTPVEMAAGNDAIIVGMNGVDDCFDYDAADTPELQYFDATLADVEAATCVDTSRVFVSGFSGGSWITNFLGCARAGVIRAQATVGGGLPPLPAACAGPIPAMYVSDTDDQSNPPAGVMTALARVVAANGCSDETTPYDPGVPLTAPSTCVQYEGCKDGYPVVWCLTSGFAHTDQAATTHLSTTGFWRFWTALP
jgi:poly(3-hydroxybutyrate) depolymerase